MSAHALMAMYIQQPYHLSGLERHFPAKIRRFKRQNQPSLTGYHYGITALLWSDQEIPEQEIPEIPTHCKFRDILSSPQRELLAPCIIRSSLRVL